MYTVPYLRLGALTRESPSHTLPSHLLAGDVRVTQIPLRRGDDSNIISHPQ
jgi:hypothetical protein